MADRRGHLAPIGVHLPLWCGRSPTGVGYTELVSVGSPLARSRAVPRILPRRHRPRRRCEPPDGLDRRRSEAAGANRDAIRRTARDAGSRCPMTATAEPEQAQAVTILDQPLVRFGPEVAADLK